MTLPGLTQKAYRVILAVGIFFSFETFRVYADTEKTSPVLTAALDRDTAHVADIVTLTLRYRLPDGARLQDPVEIKGLEQLMVIDQYVMTDQITLKLLVGLSDSWKTGPISVAYLDKKGEKKVLASNPISLKILSDLSGKNNETAIAEKSEETALKPIEGIIPAPKNYGLKYGLWTVGLVAILLLVLFFERWIMKGTIKKSAFIPPDPPHSRAEKDLEELMDRELFEKGEVKKFYFILSEIMRRYLESLRGLPAKELTTQEIGYHIHYDVDHTLLVLLQRTDRVKFADTIPTRAQKDKDVLTAFSYIQETVPGPASQKISNRTKGIMQ